ncbi:MAG TPA: glycerol-3-phosphate dehydrogenase/oxidase [Cyclobacteriaceae bacterium]|nr:glycerol-3-phosphate dehydrogenase/oxidase [Cyclobacteriaceae bacterium]
MDRNKMIDLLRNGKVETWDVLVIGGGATGLGTALESVTRGYRTVLVERHDFAKATSSRSTKLIHGGVRYLQQGDIGLVFEALHERGLLRLNAPHLVHNQAFIIPNYDWWDGPFYTIGLKVYDTMAGRFGLGPSVHITKEETMKAIPNLKEEGLRGGVIYYDGQFDDARLAVNLAQTVADYGGIISNYMKVTSLIKNDEKLVSGAHIVDMETGENHALLARSVINCTGVFADDILQMDDPSVPKSIVPSQGVHLILDREFLQGDFAIMIPKTSDGRVLFAVPWYDKVIVGTTDTLVDEATLEPKALDEEIKFILDTAAQYLTKKPSREDVKSIFAGLRPLAASGQGKSTKEISRGHRIIVSLSGLITTVGGKWTTYRKMGEETIDKAVLVAGLPERDSVTKSLPIHGADNDPVIPDTLQHYGTDRHLIRELINDQPALAEKLHPDFNFIAAEVVWAVRSEMARTVEDVLARRVRALFLDAKASIAMAPVVAQLMAKELDKDEAWKENQIAEFEKLAQCYI